MSSTADTPAPNDHPASERRPVTVVFVHGFLDGGAIWDEVAAAVRRPHLTTVQVDLAGMGSRFDSPGPFTLERYAADVTAEIDPLDGALVLVAQSMGAQVAELVAAARPERVAGLVLLAPVPLAGTRLPAEATAPFARLGGDPDAQRAVRRQLSVSHPVAELERLVRSSVRIPARILPEIVEAWNNGHPDGARPSRYTGPVMLLRASGDPFVTREVFDTGVSPRFPAARSLTVEGSGHWPHVEQPEAVAELLNAFLGVIGEPPGTVRAQAWTSAFTRQSAEVLDLLSPVVQLQASVLTGPVTGRDRVRATIAAAGRIYESLVFTREARHGSRTYLEWEGAAFSGRRLNGVTVLTENDEGLITGIAIHHRPLSGVLEFSAALRERLDGVIEPGLFHSADQE